MTNGTPTVTAKMAEALLLIHEVGPLAESNRTDGEQLTIYHATAKRLLDAGLIQQLGHDGFSRPLFGLTPGGLAFIEARR